MERVASRMYWYASMMAVLEASLLFILGLDWHVEQVQTLLIFGLPAPSLMYLCARWRLIIRHVRPIDAVYTAQPTRPGSDTIAGAERFYSGAEPANPHPFASPHAPCLNSPAASDGTRDRRTSGGGAGISLVAIPHHLVAVEVLPTTSS